MRRFCLKGLALSALLLAMPAAASAQATIAGVVKDASGAVLPGVTVEAASPALTEKIRSVATDGSGQYRIVDLRPGTYAVTFSLPGFTTVKREGIQLTGSFTATIDAELRVGSLQETVTVTGETPIVDVQSARRQSVIDGNVLNQIPTSRSYNNVLQLVPGVVAGDGQVQLRPTMLLFSAHGGNAEDGRLTLDGINTGASRGGAGVSGYVADMQNVQEVTFTISGNLGEAETGGPQMTIVPKSGGNTISGSFFYSGLNDKMQGENFDASQRAVLAAPAKTLLLSDLQGSIGGPIRKDRFWYFFNYRQVKAADAQPGIFANKNAGDPTKWLYEPDFTRQGRIDNTRNIGALRLTMQMTPRNKLAVFWDEQPQCTGASWTDQGCAKNKEGWISGGSQVNGFFGPGTNSPETGDYAETFNRVQQVKYTSPATSKLLLDAGFGTYLSKWGYDERPGNPTHDLVRVQEQSAQVFDRNGNRLTGAAAAGCADCVTIGGNLKYRSSNWPSGKIFAHTWNASLSYVTGAHNMKFGYQGAYHRDDDKLFNVITNSQRMAFRFNNGVPNQVTIQAGPWKRLVRTEYYAFFAQEQWTRDRLTLQGALRFDHAWSHFPEQVIGPDRWIPNRLVVPAAKGIEGYNDFSPRFGAAYDLFGNAKTSLKFNLGEYMHPASDQGRYINANPSERIVTIVSRNWTDGNGNFNPDCDLLNAAAQDNRASGGDLCAAWDDPNYGKARPSTTLAPDILKGWGARPHDWQMGASVQQQIFSRVSAEVGYYRRWWYSYAGTDITDNVLVPASGYDQFSVTAPSDPRLPNGGGYVVNGLYNLNPAYVGLSENVQDKVEAFGNYQRYWDGVDLTVQARLRNGLTVQGGTSTGRTVEDNCDARQKVPETAPTNPYCRRVEPFLTMYKGLATYIIPKVDVNVSGTFSSRPGVPLSANVVYSNAAVQQSLGRPLSQNAQVVVINVLEPNKLYGNRINQVDTRIGKIIRVNRTRTSLNLDIVNLLNSNDNLGYSPTFGPTWPAPTSVLTARLFRLSAQFDF